MIEPLEGLPSGVIGFEAIGEVEAAHSTGVLASIIPPAAARGPMEVPFLRLAERDAALARAAS